MGAQAERVKTSLQIEEDIDLHIKGWIFQRIGWALMLIFLVSAVLGLFGSGALSEKTITKDGTSIKFDRFERRENDTQLEIVTQQGRGRLVVAFSPAFTESFRIEDIVPGPAEEATRNGHTVYTFAADARAQLTFFLTTRKAGNIRSELRVNDTDFELRQFIYP